MKLYPNTIAGLTWGLKNFDGIEYDIRLNADDTVVIFHDPIDSAGRKILELTDDQIGDIPTLAGFFAVEEVRNLLKDGRLMFIELKPGCYGDMSSYSKRLYQRFQQLVESYEIPRESVNIISFSEELLGPFVNSYPVYPLLPSIDECKPAGNDILFLLKNLPKVLFKGMKSHLINAKNKGYAGVFFARQYIIGPLSYRHMKYKKLVKYAESLGLKVGTNLGDPSLEKNYPLLYRFSDKLSIPRRAREDEAPIIAHRGTGTKGVEIDE